MGKFIDLTGRTFGRLTVLQKDGNTSDNHIKWCCICTCGTNVSVDGRDLRKGSTKSCGCLLKEKVTERIVRMNTKHSGCKTRLYNIWRGVLDRCQNMNNSNYKHYGGRGIKVCEEWSSDFIPFRDWSLNNGYEDYLTIDRINVNGDYEPSNCRWVTTDDQQNNKRTNILITYNNTTKTSAQWDKLLGYTRGTVGRRLKNGWSVERIMTEKPYIGKNQYSSKLYVDE